MINTTQQQWVQELNSAHQTHFWYHTSQLWVVNVLLLSLHTQPTVEVFQLTHLVFQPNWNWGIPKELGEPHALSAEIIFFREIGNLSPRQWNYKTTSPPGAAGAGAVVLQYLLQSEISNLEIRDFFQNTVIQMQAFPCELLRLKGGVQLDTWNTTTKSSIHQIKCTFP